MYLPVGTIKDLVKRRQRNAPEHHQHLDTCSYNPTSDTVILYSFDSGLGGPKTFEVNITTAMIMVLDLKEAISRLEFRSFCNVCGEPINKDNKDKFGKAHEGQAHGN
jgi:hypothetical protein